MSRIWSKKWGVSKATNNFFNNAMVILAYMTDLNGFIEQNKTVKI